MSEDQLRKELGAVVKSALDEYARSMRGAREVSRVMQTSDTHVQVMTPAGCALSVVIGKFKR